MNKKFPLKKKKNSSRQVRSVTKDNAGHLIEELYGVHIISQDDIEHHSGSSQKKSEASGGKTLAETKSKDNFADTK